jgi:hypothetical protein
MTWILTHSGKHFDFADPQPDQIDLLDIAQGLANECRYAGQSRVFYSVAQHCVIASHIVSPDHAIEALLHDAAEAYCKDIPKPLKRLLPDYQAVEARVDAAIREKFRLPATQSGQVKRADLILLATERRDLIRRTIHRGRSWRALLLWSARSSPLIPAAHSPCSFVAGSR